MKKTIQVLSFLVLLTSYVLFILGVGQQMPYSTSTILITATSLYIFSQSISIYYLIADRNLFKEKATAIFYYQPPYFKLARLGIFGILSLMYSVVVREEKEIFIYFFVLGILLLGAEIIELIVHLWIKPYRILLIRGSLFNNDGHRSNYVLLNKDVKMNQKKQSLHVNNKGKEVVIDLKRLSKKEKKRFQKQLELYIEVNKLFDMD